MPATIADAIQAAVTAWDDLIIKIGVQADFTLHTGEQFQLTVAKRKRPDESMTDGLAQKGFEIQFMGSRWAAVAPAGREPEKGDQMVMNGRRHAIEWAKPVYAGPTLIGFIARVLG